MEQLNLSKYDKYTLQKIVSEQTQCRQVLEHLREQNKINLIPFLEDVPRYLKLVPERSLTFKCLRDIERLYQIYLLKPDAEITIQRFIDDMKEKSKSKATDISMAFNFYRKAVYQLTNIHNPLVGRLEGLKLYGLGSPLLKSIDLLSEKKFGKTLKRVESFNRRNKNGKDAYIKNLLKNNPPGTLYKTLWGIADKEIIGNIKLSTFENNCSKIKKRLSKKGLG